MLSGKDSMIVLALAANLGFKLHALHMYNAPDLACIEEPLQEAAARCGAEYFTLPTFQLGRVLHHGVLCDADPEAPANLGLHDIEEAARRRTGCEWIAAGRRVSDFGLPWQAQHMRKCQGVFRDLRRIEAVWDWQKADVLAAYEPGGVCHRRGIPFPVPVGPPNARGGQGRGLNLFGRHLRWLRDRPCPHTPSCWQRLCWQFPFAPAAVARLEHYGPQVEQIRTYL